eukprot:5613291-Prymnesium_polylepis.1
MTHPRPPIDDPPTPTHAARDAHHERSGHGRTWVVFLVMTCVGGAVAAWPWVGCGRGWGAGPRHENRYH